MKKKGFLPLVDDKTKILVLGTMPSEKSLKSGEYYANPTNQFWRIIFRLFNCENSLLTYSDKVNLLMKKNIGLWDVLAKAKREGSLDSNIRDIEINDFEQFFLSYPNVSVLIFNGQKPAAYFYNCYKSYFNKDYFILPSTSSANTSKPFDVKLIDWKSIITKYTDLQN